MKITVYLHSSKESNYETGKQAGLEGDALEYFMYACYEVKVDLDVDKKTGQAKIVAVDDCKLEAK